MARRRISVNRVDNIEIFAVRNARTRRVTMQIGLAELDHRTRWQWQTFEIANAASLKAAIDEASLRLWKLKRLLRSDRLEVHEFNFREGHVGPEDPSDGYIDFGVSEAAAGAREIAAVRTRRAEEVQSQRKRAPRRHAIARRRVRDARRLHRQARNHKRGRR